jgi:PAS domain S-box-containing protein
MLGYTPEEPLGQPVAKYLHPDDKKWIMKQFVSSFTNPKKTINIEFRVFRKDGSIAWLFASPTVTRLKGRILQFNSLIFDITRQKEYEMALKEGEERYRQLVENSPDSIAIHQEGKIVYINQAGIKLLKAKNAKQIIGKPIMDFVHPDYRIPIKRRVKAVIKKGGQVPAFEEKLNRLNGEEIDVETTGIATTYKGKPAVQAMVRNITKRKLAEDELRDSEERYRALMDALPDSVYVLDRQWRHVLVNKTAEQYVKMTKQKLLGNKLTKLFPGIERTPFFKTFKKVMDTRRAAIVENEYIFTNGRKGYYEVRVHPVAEGILCVSTDRTERKRTEEVIKQKIVELSSFINNIPDMAWLKDINSNFIAANQAFGEAVGMEPEYLVNHTCEICFGKEAAKKFKEDDKKVIGSKKQIKIEESIIDKKGNTVYLETIKSPIVDESRKVIGTVGIARDITERKLAESNVIKTQEQLRSLTTHLQTIREEERANIAREIHDELGQALTALKMDMAWCDKNLPRDISPGIIKRKESMKRLLDSTIQTVKRISSELRPGILDDLGLVAALEWLSGSFMQRTGVACSFLADVKKPITNKGLATALFRIYQEALTNVTRHAQASKVETSLIELDGWLEMVIQDNGKGITSKSIADPQSFGLLGMQERAHSIGGAVKIEGVKGKGTTVRVRVPIE